MKAKHHFWSSLAAGGALYWATGSSAALAGSMMGGFLVDADHIIDQLWSMRHGAPYKEPGAEKPGTSIPANTSTRVINLFRPRMLNKTPQVRLVTSAKAVSRTPAMARNSAFVTSLDITYNRPSSWPLR